MKIHLLHFSAGAEKARGLAVVIDVFRASSLVCYVFDRGASGIVAVRDVERALEWRKRDPRCVLVGERHGRRISGFDFGNSPTEISGADLAGHTVVHTTHAGTRALAAAADAEDVITGSFVNAGAVLGYIERFRPREVSLVCAGFEGRREALEDTLCAEYLRDALAGKRPRFEEIRDKLRLSESAARFFDPAETHSPESDFDLCLDLNRFSFVVRRIGSGRGECVLERVDA